MKLIQSNIIYQTAKQSYQLLSPEHRRKSYLMIVIILISGVLDIIGLGLLFGIINMATNISIVHTNEVVASVYHFFKFSSEQNFLFMLVGGMVVFFVVKNIVTLYFFYVTSRFSYQVAENLTERRFKEFFEWDFLKIKSINSNITSNNITSIPIDFSTTILMPMFSFLSELVVLILIAIGIAFTMTDVLFLLVIILLPATSLFYRVIKKRSQNMGNARNQDRYMVYQLLYQNIHGHIDVLLNNKVSFFLKKYFVRLRSLYRHSTLLIVIETAPTKFIEIAAILGIFLIFLYSYITDMGMSNVMNYLMLFAVAAYRLMPSINRMMNSLVKIKSGQYIFTILNGLPQLPVKFSLSENVNDDIIEIPDFNESIAFDNISYRYAADSKLVLNNLSFKVKKGEVIGFIGRSGSGKSTIFNIVLRLLIENSGRFLIDGKTLAANHISGWRHLIGYVRQDYYLLDTSLAQNIAFGVGQKNIDYEKLNDCIKKASLTDLVNSLPNGIESNIGEHGGKLSGGQKQRIAIARALYHDSEIILFDEATSALDSNTENEIIETINNLFGEKKTVLMIAHRYTTLKKCSRIHEVSEGTISKTYTYQELIDSKLYV